MAQGRMLNAPQDQGVLFDEIDDILISIELCEDSAAKIAAGNDRCWKWCVVAAHSTVQATFVVTLSGSTGVGAFHGKLIERWLNWLDSFGASALHERRPNPRQKLADFMELVVRIQDMNRMRAAGKEPVMLSDSEKAELRYLNETRNKFMHYVPESWHFSHGEMARSVINALSVAESTLIQHPPTAFLADESRFVEATAKMRRAREALQPLVDHLDAVLANAKA